MKYLLQLLILVASPLLSAQSKTNAAITESHVFLQVSIGILPYTFAPCAEVSAAVGYRFDRRWGLGVEFRGTLAGNESITRSASVLGIHLRSQLGRKWLTGLGGGKVLGAYESSDGSYAYEYRSGGRYVSLDLGCQLRSGVTLGIYGTVVWGQTHYNLYLNDTTGVYERTGTFSTDEFAGAGVKVGYAFPRRKR